MVNDMAAAGVLCEGWCNSHYDNLKHIRVLMFAHKQSIKDMEQRIVVIGEFGHAVHLLHFDAFQLYDCMTFNYAQVKLRTVLAHNTNPGFW